MRFAGQRHFGVVYAAVTLLVVHAGLAQEGDVAPKDAAPSEEAPNAPDSRPPSDKPTEQPAGPAPSASSSSAPENPPPTATAPGATNATDRAPAPSAPVSATVAPTAPSPDGAAQASIVAAPASAAAAAAPTDESAGISDTAMKVGAVDVVVTGKRSRTLDLPGSVDVIGEDQTSKEVTTNALDLMRRIPGFAYQDYGNGGTPNGFMMRGFSSNHGNDTLVVIDGVPINEHGWYGQDDGSPDLNMLTSEEIERIEVIKGPLDARYGNWGRSGIVLINTRQRGDFMRANLIAGSYGTRKLYGSFGSEHFDGKFNQVYSVESFESTGWRENSAQQRQNAYAKWFYRPTKGVKMGLFTHFYRADWSTGSYIDEAQWQRDARAAFSGSANDGGYKSLSEVALHTDTKLCGKVPVKAILWHRVRNGSRYADWTYEGTGQTEDHGFERVTGGIVSAESDWKLPHNQTLVVDGGVDYRYFNTHGQNWVTRARAREVLNSEDRWVFQNGGIYLKSSYDISKRVRFSAGIREDLFWGRHADYLADTSAKMNTYSVPTYKGGVVGNVLENLSLYGNVGTTYRLPNQSAKYERPAPPVADLLFWELGMKASAFDLLTLRYAYFQSDERLTRLEQGQYLDDGKGRRSGHEIVLKVDPIKEISIFTALTFHDSHYVGGANAGNHLATVPRYIWKVGAQGEAPWGTGLRVNYNDVGKWHTDPANTHSYGGYRVVDASLYQILAKDWSIALDAKNLTNAKYSEFVGFWTGSNQYMPSNPLTVFASLRYAKD